MKPHFFVYQEHSLSNVLQVKDEVAGNSPFGQGTLPSGVALWKRASVRISHIFKIGVYQSKKHGEPVLKYSKD